MGYFRLALALLITLAHLGPAEGLLRDLRWWEWCVGGFYVLSGYLMTLLTQTRYRGQRWRFLWLRALRIFPTYWAVLLLSLAGFVLMGGQVNFQPWLAWPAPGDLLPQALLLISLDSMPFVPVVTAWTLTVELFWWAAISFGIFDQRRQTFALLAVACAVYPMLRPDYYGILWGFVPFALGASLYWAGLTIPHDGQAAAWAGALSYPVYLTHYQLGAFIAAGYGLERGWPLFWLSLVPTLALSVALVLWVEKPVEAYRKRLRSTTSTQR